MNEALFSLIELVEFPGPVKNIAVTPKLHMETTSIQLTWNAPDAKTGQNVSGFYYIVDYCIQGGVCKNTTKIYSLEMELSGLMINSNYEIRIERSGNLEGSVTISLSR